MIQPIQTHYAGHHFRSRLEARWAVFFNTAGIPWEYEPEGYNLPTGPYLPDFWLPHTSTTWDRGRHEETPGVWLEIKGTKPTPREERLCAELAQATGHNVYIAAGPIPTEVSDRWGTHIPGHLHLYTGFTDGQLAGDIDHAFTGPTTISYDPQSDALNEAFRAARCARFEHGETPRP